MKPNFFILGAPKCGTTALSEYLRLHPRVFVSPQKEPHFFDSDFNFPRGDLSSYLALYSKADPGVHLAVGEATTNYLRSEKAVPGILRLYPEAKFIVMLRDPADLIPARHSQFLFMARENIRDVLEAWKAEPDRRAGKRLPPGCREPKMLYYSEWGNFGDQIERLFSQVPRERVLVILLEDFSSDTRATYEKVLAFLGVPSDGRREFPRINEGRSVRWMGPQMILFGIARAADWVKLKLGINRRFGFVHSLFKLNVDFSVKKKASENFRMELKEHYRGQVLKLSKLLGRDLSEWT